MSDDKSKQGTQDDIRIDVNDPSELQYVAKKFGITADEVRQAIQRAGTDLREDIYKILKRS